ncbi:MAG: cytochrome c oxidase assembly protein [Acidimicrobiia bacterium]
MLTRILLHPGQPVAPHDLWSSWNLDPLLLGGIAALVWLNGRGRRRPNWKWFGVAVVALGLALVSPLEAMSGALASAHMSQHLLLILVAAPAFVYSEAGAGVLAGLPLTVRSGLGAARRTLGLVPARVRRFSHPVLVWLLHAGVLLFWHAAGPYQLALRSEPIHYLEHASFLLTALWFWQLVLSTRHRSVDWPGAGVLMVFGMAGQSVFLALLMTFADNPWYAAYANTTATWGMTPLTDQHLAGVIMWVPAGFVYTGVGLTLLARWLTAIETRTSTNERAAARSRIGRDLGD